MSLTPLEKIQKDFQTLLKVSKKEEPTIYALLLEYRPERWSDGQTLRKTYFQWLKEDEVPPEQKTEREYQRSLKRGEQIITFTRSDLGYDESISSDEGGHLTAHSGCTTCFRPLGRASQIVTDPSGSDSKPR